MDSISRYHLSRHEDGSWHVIDKTTGGPAEVEVDGGWVVLWKLTEAQAKGWSAGLNMKTGKLGRNKPSP